MTILIIIVAVLVIAYLLYVGNRRRQVEAARKREKLGAEAEGHRSMASSHEEKAAEQSRKRTRERTATPEVAGTDASHAAQEAREDAHVARDDLE
mgnify:CR=1 FL=1